MTTHGLCPTLSVLIVYMSYLSPTFLTQSEKLAFVLKQQSVGDMEEDMGKENSPVQGNTRNCRASQILPGKAHPQIA